ncbi:putative adenylate/guanylate cyclase [Sediminispirochaeta smaragdinae DSM 11293]|jgi:class 3 adenylate cyclase|uniref:Adenylate/guanylate cyclase n=2 Tax=Sediminispirochaeta TaxID=1911556 RepID=E1RCR6_SEDSS|nr:putative adenylate/guanylate cyclase [Sediminispirochaeta smaragdinae DSM 11293]
MLDPSLHNHIAEMMTKSLKPDQIDELGCLLMNHYCSHTILGLDSHITVPTRKAATAFIQECEQKGYEERLLKLLIEIDGNQLLGKTVNLEGIEEMRNMMLYSGLVYDEKKRKIRKLREDPSELSNWGALKQGKRYDMTIASVDIVGNSAIVKKHGIKKAEKLYFRFWAFLRKVLEDYDGRIWNWAGDGGILAFTFKGHQQRAVMFALEVQSLIGVFNASPDKPVNEIIRLRIGLDTGKIKFADETGQIVSETINYAAHLEKNGTDPGSISVSDELIGSLPKSLRALFKGNGVFEERKTWKYKGALQ